MKKKKQQRVLVKGGVSGTKEVNVEMLGDKLARVLPYPDNELDLFYAVDDNDLLQLNANPGDTGGLPEAVAIFQERKVDVCVITVHSEENRNRMVALAAVFGAEVLNIEEHPGPDEECNYEGIMLIRHPADIEFTAIAEAAGLDLEMVDAEEE